MPFHEQAREFLWFCAPALILGFVLRVLMTWQMPYGYMQFDSADFLSTTARFLSKGHFVIHSKRTFLVPLLYALPFIFKVPALIVIPIFQHLLGTGILGSAGTLFNVQQACNFTVAKTFHCIKVEYCPVPDRQRAILSRGRCEEDRWPENTS